MRLVFFSYSRDSNGRKVKVDAMTQTERVYASNRNGDTVQECINIDMIKLLKDQIAFLRGELSRELRSNQKTKELTLSNLSEKMR